MLLIRETWRPHRDSNSGYRRERAVSWASRRWGLFRAGPDTTAAAERKDLPVAAPRAALRFSLHGHCDIYSGPGDMRRSFWAWGWEERLPDQAAREALGAHVATTLGSPASEPRPLPALDQATAAVRAARVAPPSEIADICD